MQGTKDRNIRIEGTVDLAKSMQRSSEGSGKNWYVQGYATTPDLDLQDDMVDPNGLDISYFLEKGHINYEHQKGEDYIIGRPTDKSYVDPNVGLFVEAKLEKNNSYAKSMWEEAQFLAKTNSSKKLGFSIEGIALERDALDDRVIRKTRITNVALTASPANPNAVWDALMKSFVTGHGITPDTQVNAGALRAESFASSLAYLANSYQTLSDPKEFNKLWKEVGQELDKMGAFNAGTAVLYLQLSKNITQEEAIDALLKIMNG